MTQGKRTIAEGRFTRYVTMDGWEYVERKNVSGIVGIVAVTDDKKWILVEQFRKPVGGRVIELPAGLAGDAPGQEDEPLQEAAQRELVEETGYEAGGFEFLTEGPISAGITDEILTFYLATELKKVSDGGGAGRGAGGIAQTHPRGSEGGAEVFRFEALSGPCSQSSRFHPHESGWNKSVKVVAWSTPKSMRVCISLTNGTPKIAGNRVCFVRWFPCGFSLRHVHACCVALSWYIGLRPDLVNPRGREAPLVASKVRRSRFVVTGEKV